MLISSCCIVCEQDLILDHAFPEPNAIIPSYNSLSAGFLQRDGPGDYHERRFIAHFYHIETEIWNPSMSGMK